MERKKNNVKIRKFLKIILIAGVAILVTVLLFHFFSRPYKGTYELKVIECLCIGVRFC